MQNGNFRSVAKYARCCPRRPGKAHWDSSLKAKIDRINNAFAEGSLAVDEFKELKNPLVPKKAGLEQEIIGLEQSKANRLEPLRNWVLQANTAEKPF